MKVFAKLMVVISTAIILTATTFLFGCNGNTIEDIASGLEGATTKLSTPTNIYVDDNGVLRWDTVENAGSYLVVVGESEYSRTTPACDLKKIITKNGIYDIYVKAISGDILYKNSELSPVFVYTYDGEVVTNGNTQTGMFGQFDNVFTELAYIGFGYDVINSPYVVAQEVKMNFPIFDQEKLKNKKLAMIKENNLDEKYTFGDSVEEYQKQFEENLGGKINVAKAFAGSLSAKYKSTNENTVSLMFYEYRHTTVKYNLVLQCDFEEYKELLTDAFKRDLMTLDYGTLFQRYGTHVITSAVMGGRFDFNYTMLSDKFVESESLSEELKAKVNAWNVDASLTAGAEIDELARKNNCTIDRKVIVSGGDSFDMASEEALLKNKQKWLDSIDANPALVGIRDINSLVGIWELLGDTPEEQERKAEMYSMFEKYSNDAYNSILENYKIKPAIKPESLSVDLVDSDGNSMEDNAVPAGSIIKLKLNIEPALAIITKTVTSEQSQYFEFDSESNSLFIKPDTPHNTKIYITVDIGCGVSRVIVLNVITQCTVTFNSNGGSFVKACDVALGSTVDKPIDPTKENFAFDGWYIDSDCTVPFEFGKTSISGDTTLFAKWVEKYIEITFDSNYGTEVEAKNIRIGGSIGELPVAYRNGFELEGWYTVEGDKVSSDTTFVDSCVLIARWKELEIYNITYDAKGGELSGAYTQSFSINDEINLPTAAKKYFIFVGWCIDETLNSIVDINKILQEPSNITLYAKWEQEYKDYTYISNRTQLENIKNNLSGKYMLISDIDLSDKAWVKLGTFTGVLMGNGYTIHKLHCSVKLADGGDFYGLFAKIHKAKIDNLTFKDTDIFTDNDSNQGGNFYVGTLAGYAVQSTVTKVTTRSSVKMDGSYGGNAYVGGIVGFSESSTFEDCTNSAYILAAKGAAYAGGIVGGCSGPNNYKSNFRRCTNLGAVNAHLMVFLGHARAAGIVGYATDANFSVDASTCSNSGELSTWGSAGATYKENALWT